MKNKVLLALFACIIATFHCPLLFGQSQQSTVEVFKDTLFILKQADFNRVNSRKTLHFELPPNTVKWLYYFESIDKMQISDALARNYYTPADFGTDSINKTNKGAGYTTARKVGPEMLEVLLLDNEGEEQFLRRKNDVYVFTRPQHYIISGSALCEVGDCNSSGKILVDTNSTGKLILGFRNIDYRENAYIIVQIVAMVNQ